MKKKLISRGLGSALTGVMSLVAMLGLFGPADAANIQCERCSTSEMVETATYLGDGTHLAFNIAGNSAVEVVVSGWGWSPITFPPPEYVNASPGQPSPSVIRAVGALHEWHSAIQGVAQPIVLDYSSSGLPYHTALTLPYDGNASTQLEDAIRHGNIAINSPSLSNALLSLRDIVVQTILSQLSLNDSLELRIVVRFNDGSTREYRINPKGPSVEYVPGSARTGDTVPQLIPDPGYQQSINWHSGGDLSGLWDYINHESFGGTHVLVGGGCPAGRVDSISCVWKANENHLYCVARYGC